MIAQRITCILVIISVLGCSKSEPEPQAKQLEENTATTADVVEPPQPPDQAVVESKDDPEEQGVTTPAYPAHWTVIKPQGEPDIKLHYRRYVDLDVSEEDRSNGIFFYDLETRRAVAYRFQSELVEKDFLPAEGTGIFNIWRVPAGDSRALTVDLCLIVEGGNWRYWRLENVVFGESWAPRDRIPLTGAWPSEKQPEAFDAPKLPERSPLQTHLSTAKQKEEPEPIAKKEGEEAEKVGVSFEMKTMYWNSYPPQGKADITFHYRPREKARVMDLVYVDDENHLAVMFDMRADLVEQDFEGSEKGIFALWRVPAGDERALTVDLRLMFPEGHSMYKRFDNVVFGEGWTPHDRDPLTNALPIPKEPATFVTPQLPERSPVQSLAELAINNE